MPTDRDGNEVTVGTVVRVLKLSAKWLAILPDEDRVDALSMLGETFRVREIDSYGRACIMKEWQEGPGRFRVHEIALDPEEMLVVECDVSAQW